MTRAQSAIHDAIAFLQRGQFTDAERLCNDVLRTAQKNAEALHILGIICLQTGRAERAVELITKSIEGSARDALAHGNLGSALAMLDRRDEALVSFDKAIALKSDFADAHNNRGETLNELKRYEEALASCDAAIALRAGFAAAFNNRGIALQNLGRREDALASFRRAIALNPASSGALDNLGILLLEEGRLDEAHDAHVRAIEREPRRVASYRLLAGTGRIAQDSPHLRRMEQLASRMDLLSEAEQIELHFARASVYGDCGEYARSFRHLLDGNRLKRSRIVYDEAATFASFDHIRAVFTTELLQRGGGHNSRLPVFVVGMPRSGTTLVEQILASHPEVSGAGEVMDMRRVVDTLSAADPSVRFPEAVTDLPATRLEELGAIYLDGLRSSAPPAARIVDKLPDNFLRIGLIRLLLPEARIIHVRRDPVDTCLSCFSKLFAGHMPYVYDLAELGRFYRAYERLMAHWRQIVPPHILLEVNYEDVVNDLEGQVRRMLDHCELAWDARCLTFHQSQRSVRTASAAQVRQPLYKGAVGRWRAFGDLARPLIDALTQQADVSASDKDRVA